MGPSAYSINEKGKQFNDDDGIFYFGCGSNTAIIVVFSKGTCKIGQFCTSSLEVVRCDGRIEVTYFIDHHNHDLDFPSLVHMKLPKCEKDKIAGTVIMFA